MTAAVEKDADDNKGQEQSQPLFGLHAMVHWWSEPQEPHGDWQTGMARQSMDQSITVQGHGVGCLVGGQDETRASVRSCVTTSYSGVVWYGMARCLEEAKVAQADTVQVRWRRCWNRCTVLYRSEVIIVSVVS